jgi:hypothetical protein
METHTPNKALNRVGGEGHPPSGNLFVTPFALTAILP